MNCDEAFDAMTNPQRTESDGLANHLARCVRCRQMREMLFPAIDLLAASSADDTGDDTANDDSYLSPRTPSPRPFLHAETLAAAEAAAATLSKMRASDVPKTAARWSQRGWRSLAVAALVMACLMPLTYASLPGISVAPAAECTWRIHASAPNDSQMTAGRAEADRREVSRQVVLTCMACHIPAVPSTP